MLVPLYPAGAVAWFAREAAWDVEHYATAWERSPIEQRRACMFELPINAALALVWPASAIARGVIPQLIRWRRAELRQQ